MLLLAAVLPTGAQAGPPKRVTVAYDLSHNGSVLAEVKETLEQDGRSYRIHSEGRPRGLLALAVRGAVTRSSVGSIGPHGLRPTEFRDQRGSNLTIARFDWAGGKLAQEHKGRSDSQPMPANLVDRLSFLWGFAFVAPDGSTIDALVADGRGAPDRMRYRVAGKQMLQTPAGSIEALHLVKQRDPDDPRETEIWLGVKHHLLPVRILVKEKDGTRIDQVVTRIDD